MTKVVKRWRLPASRFPCDAASAKRRALSLVDPLRPQEEPIWAVLSAAAPSAAEGAAADRQISRGIAGGVKAECGGATQLGGLADDNLRVFKVETHPLVLDTTYRPALE